MNDITRHFGQLQTFSQMRGGYAMLEGEEPIETAKYGKFLNTNKVCPVCQKAFHIDLGWVDRWAYKRGRSSGRIYLCSWKCLNNYDKEHKNGKKKRNTDADHQRAERNSEENN